MTLELWAKINPWLGCFHLVFSYSNTKPWPVALLCNTIKSGILGQIVTAAVHSVTPSLPARRLTCHPCLTSKLPTMSSPAYLHGAHSITPSLPAWCPQCHLQPNCKALSVSPPGYLQAAYTVTAMRLLSLPAQHTVITNRKKKTYQWEIDTDCSTKPNRILVGANFLEESLVLLLSRLSHGRKSISHTPFTQFCWFFWHPTYAKKIIYSKCLRGGKIRASCSADWNLYRFLQPCFQRKGNVFYS